jgi:hypothetical protein
MHHVCPECSKSFYNEKGLKSQVVHTKERPYKCRFCEADFKYTGNKLNHDRGIHRKGRGSIGSANSRSPERINYIPDSSICIN